MIYDTSKSFSYSYCFNSKKRPPAHMMIMCTDGLFL